MNCCELTKNLKPVKERFDEPHFAACFDSGCPTDYEMQVFECVCTVCGGLVEIKERATK